MTDGSVYLALCFWLSFGVVLMLLLGFSKRKRERHWANLRAAGMPREQKQESRSLFAGLLREAQAAGLELQAGHILAVLLAGMCAGAVVGLAATGSALFAAAGASLGLLAPGWWVRKKIEGRTKVFEDQLEKGLSAMTASLYAGSNTAQAMEEAARQSQPPLQEVLLETLRLVKTGVPLPEALEEAGRKVRSKDMEMVATAVMINLRTGARLVSVLDHVAESVRERRAFKAQVSAKCAQAKMAANVLVMVPLAFLTIFHLMNPGYLQPLTHTPAGNVILMFAFAMFFFGWALIRKMLDVEGAV